MHSVSCLHLHLQHLHCTVLNDVLLFQTNSFVVHFCFTYYLRGITRALKVSLFIWVGTWTVQLLSLSAAHWPVLLPQLSCKVLERRRTVRSKWVSQLTASYIALMMIMMARPIKGKNGMWEKARAGGACSGESSEGKWAESSRKMSMQCWSSYKWLLEKSTIRWWAWWRKSKRAGNVQK